MCSKTVKSLNFLSRYLKDRGIFVTQFRVHVSGKGSVITLVEMCDRYDIQPSIAELIYDGESKTELEFLVNKSSNTFFKDTIIEGRDIGDFFKTIKVMVRRLNTFMRDNNLLNTLITIDKECEDTFSETFSLTFTDSNGNTYTPMQTSVNYFSGSDFENALIEHRLSL